MSSRRSSRSSTGQDVFPSHERLVLDLNRDDLVGVSSDNLSSIGSDTPYLSDWEQERIEHIAKVMTQMPVSLYFLSK